MALGASPWGPLTPFQGFVPGFSLVLGATPRGALTLSRGFAPVPNPLGAQPQHFGGATGKFAVTLTVPNPLGAQARHFGNATCKFTVTLDVPIPMGVQPTQFGDGTCKSVVTLEVLDGLAGHALVWGAGPPTIGRDAQSLLATGWTVLLRIPSVDF